MSYELVREGSQILKFDIELSRNLFYLAQAPELQTLCAESSGKGFASLCPHLTEPV